MSYVKNKFGALSYYVNKWKVYIEESYRNKFIKIFSWHYFQTNNQNIYIGSTFSKLGGVPHHIQSIAKKSVYKPLIIPDPNILELISKWKFADHYRKILNLQVHAKPSKIIHTHVDPWFIDLALKSQSKGKIWIHTYHTIYFEKDWADGLKPWQIEVNDNLINVARKADVKIAISKWLGEHLKNSYDIDTLYIPNGVDVQKCDQADKSRFIEKYKLKDFILFASGISDIKNVGDFLRLSNALPELDFVIIGRGISVKALLEKYDLPISKNLTILGQMPHHELMDAMAACSVFVVTSRSEGLPTVLMEAMALQRTVVGCDTYGTVEVIGNDSCGYIYRHDSIEDLVQKTQMAFINQDKGLNARRRVLEEYDWRVVITKIDNLYSKLLK